ncbi:J domain-containing protein [Rhodoferax sp. GW822-FHT02A01]|uniref:J domain-containing protein n=1 Tax=Rhodoferax sp. GW822-FHT02A01 TaxID=3141537 RepID=UPI00315C983B
MERFRNYYEILGLTRAATEMEIAQAYRARLQKLQSDPGVDSAGSLAEQLKLLDEAYRTLTHPASKKKHDEQVAWQATKRDLDAEEARRLAWRLKEEQAMAEHAAKAAREASEAVAIAAELKAAEEAQRQEVQARIEALAAARFRPLAARQATGGTDFADTQPQEDLSAAPQVAASATTASRSIAVVTVLGSVLFVLLCFGGYWFMRPTQALKAATPVAMAQPAVALASEAPASAPLVPASEPAPPALAASAPPSNPPPKVDTAKSEEARQYQKALQQAERDHPELNPRSARRRDDLIAFVESRTRQHVKEGYSRGKALEIALRDLETQEQTRRLIESVKVEKPKPATESPPPVLDPGGHAGFDPKCRWVTSEQWSCK